MGKAQPDAAAFFRECFDLDEATGVLTWKVRPAHHFKSRAVMNQVNGQRAGKQVLPEGEYLGVTISGRPWKVHKIVWTMVHGKFPPTYLDHIDGDGRNNRPSNLRPATGTQNNWNARRRSNNFSGFKGVSRTDEGNYRARIHIGPRDCNLGRFPTPELAHEFWCLASDLLRGEFSRHQ